MTTATTMTIHTAYGDVELTKVGRGVSITGVPPSWGYGEHRTPRIDVIVSMILGHASAGVDVTTPAYAAGVNTAIEEIINCEDGDEE